MSDRNLGGRPAIGGHLHMMLGDQLLAAVDQLAQEQEMTRSDLIRGLVSEAVREARDDYPDQVNRSAGRRIIVSFVARAEEHKGKALSELDPADYGLLLGYARALAAAYDMPHWGGQGVDFHGTDALIADAIKWARESEDAMQEWTRQLATTRAR